MTRLLLLLGVVLAAGDGGGTGSRPHVAGTIPGTRCTADTQCDLGQICRKWQAPDDGVRCVAGCRGDADCRKNSFCGRPPGCGVEACRLCLKIDWTKP